jgi:hypothetical protein
MDPYYKKMMLWTAAALAASVLTAMIVVHWVIQTYGQ